MNILSTVKKCITGGDWFIAIRKIGENKYHVLDNIGNTWCADPLLFEEKGICYLFVEQYNKKKDRGEIGYYRIDNGIPLSKGVIIENRYHMSYPFVFSWKDDFFMIPETSANQTVDLYKATSFPEKWEIDTHLIEGKKFVDTTVWKEGNEIYLLTYRKLKNTENGATEWELDVFQLDMENRIPRLVSKKSYLSNTGRPAGPVFVQDGMTIRPAQDCKEKYGAGIILYCIDDFNCDGNFKEHEIGRILVENLTIDARIDRIHTYTRNREYEIIDCYKEKLDLFHIPRIFLRSRRN